MGGGGSQGGIRPSSRPAEAGDFSWVGDYKVSIQPGPGGRRPHDKPEGLVKWGGGYSMIGIHTHSEAERILCSATV